MRGMVWDPARGFYCRDCGGYAVDMLEGGAARCRTCGRSSVPQVASRAGNMRRLIPALLGLFGVLVAVEILAAWAFAAAAGGGFTRTFAVLAFASGFVAILVAGAGAAPGHVAYGDLRMDRMQFAAAIQDPQLVGTLSTSAKARPSGEPPAVGIFLTFAFGVALIAVAFVSTLL